MKKYFLLISLIIITMPFFAQNRLDSLKSVRLDVYRNYCEHRDTMTVNTWINIFKLNKYLLQIVAIDSIIHSETASSQANESREFEVIQSKLESLISEKKEINRRLSDAENASLTSKKNLRTAIVAGGIAFVLFILVMIFLILTFNKLKKNNSLIKEYHTKLYNAKSEIVLYQKDQDNMAAKINASERDFQEELKKMKEKLNAMSDEKTLLENQITEVKKAYDREVERRMTADEKLNSSELISGNDDNTDVSNHRSKVEDDLLYQIKLLKDEVEKEKNMRNGIENDLKILLEKLRVQYS